MADAIRARGGRGVRVRIAFNQDERPPEDDGERPFFPAPPRTEPHVLETLGVPVKPIPGWRDLMHHKYVVRDGDALWTGSMNWTLDSFTRQENVVATLDRPASPPRSRAQLRAALEHGGSATRATSTARRDGVRPWFCPGRGPELSHRIAKRIGAARRRVRIATPLLTAGPILGTLAEVIEEERVDVAGVCDATQVAQVFAQWAANPRSRWKGPLLERCLVAFHGKRSTPYAPGAIHDYMHAKVTVADDAVFLGSFNLSRSGEKNAENVLEIADAALADRLAAWIDELRARYPARGGRQAASSPPPRSRDDQRPPARSPSCGSVRCPSQLRWTERRRVAVGLTVDADPPSYGRAVRAARPKPRGSVASSEEPPRPPCVPRAHPARSFSRRGDARRADVSRHGVLAAPDVDHRDRPNSSTVLGPDRPRRIGVMGWESRRTSALRVEPSSRSSSRAVPCSAPRAGAPGGRACAAAAGHERASAAAPPQRAGGGVLLLARLATASTSRQAGALPSLVERRIYRSGPLVGRSTRYPS